MNKFYLIQRGSFNKDFKSATEFFGGRSSHLINGDYMGSAEFEWGAIPKAYRRIMYNFNKYSLHITDLVTVRGVPFCLFCNDMYYEEILNEIKEFIEKPYRLKEHSNLDAHFSEVKHSHDFNYWKYKLKTNFWWCIDIATEQHLFGDWIAFIGATDRQKAFSNIIRKDYDTWWMDLSEEERKHQYQNSISW